jgi:hypothetical protein
MSLSVVCLHQCLHQFDFVAVRGGDNGLISQGAGLRHGLHGTAGISDGFEDTLERGYGETESESARNRSRTTRAELQNRAAPTRPARDASGRFRAAFGEVDIQRSIETRRI